MLRILSIFHSFSIALSLSRTLAFGNDRARAVPLISSIYKDTRDRRRPVQIAPWDDWLKIASTSTGLLPPEACEEEKEEKPCAHTSDYNRRQNFSASASGHAGKRVARDGDRARRVKGASGGQMTGKKDAQRGRDPRRKSYVENGGTRLVGIAAKEISSVNGDNPYPGSNDGGMAAARGRSRRAGGGERKE